jgi:enoyl-CoA hydratase/carnithine racemase
VTLPVPRVEVSRERGVATLTMLGHKSVNLISRVMMDAVLATGAALRNDADLRLIVLTGAPGKGFLGGADIAEMAALTADTARAFITQLHAVCDLFRTLPVPSIARIDGPCFGAGMELAASCDLRVGSTTSRYGMPEVQVGLPSVIEARLLPGLIGWGRTRELLYRGHVINAVEAERIGFLQHIAPSADLDIAMAPIVEDILRAEPAAIRTQKRLMESWLDTNVTTGIQHSIAAFAETFQTDAPNRRLRGFFEARKNKAL